MRIRFYLISIIVCLSALSVQAQDSSVRQIYNEAEREYDIGRVEQAVSILNDNMDSFSGNVRQSAFRLMALCHLSLDDVKSGGEPEVGPYCHYHHSLEPGRESERGACAHHPDHRRDDP